MKEVRLGLRYAVILLSLLSGCILGEVEERRALNEEDVRLSALSMAISDNVQGDLLAKRTDRINLLVQKLRGQNALDALVICATGQGAHGQVYWLKERSASFPAEDALSSQAEEACPSVVAASSRLATLKRAYSPHHLWAVHARELDQGSKGPRYLTLVRDLTPIRSEWPKRFIRWSAFMLLLLSALAMVVRAQARTWVWRQISQLRLLPNTRWANTRWANTPWGGRLRRARRARGSPSTVPPAVSPAVRSLGKRKLVVVSNREPYIHQKREGKIRVVRPASGLVTALEPILRECGGLWVAHGSGNADSEVTDARDEVAVPPENPRYKLRRVWLTPEEEQGYYYGFSNEGVWPLCHLAHTRPIFRLPDWVRYRAVNRRFAESLHEEAASPDTLILIQDYHFALLPSLVRQLPRPSSHGAPRIGLFWHIPWPNPEAFGICPWSRELLEGMLGADVIGFHTQYHCNNFLETCNRYLEARIDWERFSVTCKNRETLVRAFPIGIATQPVTVLSDPDREALKEELGIRARFVAVGVDRIDYTKGLLERVEAVERFLEKNPKYVGEFSLVQVGSPSRSSIESYKDLARKLRECVDRVNTRFGRAGHDDYKPILFLAEHHDWQDIQRIYQLGDVCMVTSLHDGMNLVAKEYVWCQRPDRGSLILSRFTGASRELTEALIVNPYSIEEMADALQRALEMPAAEKAERMSAMRDKVKSRNALQWASDLIEALVPLRTAPTSVVSGGHVSYERQDRAHGRA